MHNVIKFLCGYAYDNGIGYVLEDKYNPNDVSTSHEALRMVVINMNWHNENEIPFQFAHELGHVLNGDAGTNNFPLEKTKNKEERSANKVGIQILAKYVVENELYFDSSTTFMSAFGIPTYLSDEVNQILGNVYRQSETNLIMD